MGIWKHYYSARMLGKCRIYIYIYKKVHQELYRLVPGPSIPNFSLFSNVAEDLMMMRICQVTESQNGLREESQEYEI